MFMIYDPDGIQVGVMERLVDAQASCPPGGWVEDERGTVIDTYSFDF